MEMKHGLYFRFAQGCEVLELSPLAGQVHPAALFSQLTELEITKPLDLR
jgi:hypothetical protein